MAKFSVIVSVILLALLLNYLNEPLPDELPGRLVTKIWIGALKAVFKLAPIGVLFGYDQAECNQGGIWFVGRVFPGFLLEGITLTSDNFDGIAVNIYKPSTDKLTGRGVLYFHGGGWVVGDNGEFYQKLSRVATELGAVVVFVDYRVAPQHPFPAAAEDCITSYKYFVKNAVKFNVDPSRIAVMGDSAGGNLAAVVSLATLKENFKPAPKLQVLIYPVLQGSNLNTPSYVVNKDGPFQTRELMAFFFAAYIFGWDYHKYIDTILQSNHTSPAEKRQNAKGYLSLDHLPNDGLKAKHQEKLDFGNGALWDQIKEKFHNPLFAPLFAEKMEGVSPAYVTTCHYDVLRDDGFFYVKRLRDAKVKVKHHNFACLHTWTYLMSFVKEYYDEYTNMLDYMKANI